MYGIGVADLVVVGLFVSVPLVLMFLTMYALRRGLQGRGNASDEESRLLPELLQGLKRLEERIDSLETILLEHRGKD
jgi:phage shock protein B